MNEIVAVIHAKGENKRLPKKNFCLVGTDSLIGHAVSAARKTKATRVVVDSDNKGIRAIGSLYGAEYIIRPEHLATNIATGDDLAYWQATNFPKADVIVQVVPTSPFTKPETIDKCIDNVLDGYNSSFTANRERLYTWRNESKPEYLINNKIANSNDLEGVIVEYTGVYAFNPRFALKMKKRVDIHNYKTVPISLIEKIDINYKEDLEFANIVQAGLDALKPIQEYT